MLLVSGISGAKTADMAAVAPVLFPEAPQWQRATIGRSWRLE
jgi:TRAP-type C4-dicarboxylate transport system permease large subunit